MNLREIEKYLTVRCHVVQALMSILFPVHSRQEKRQQRNAENRHGDSNINRNIILGIFQISCNKTKPSEANLISDINQSVKLSTSPE